MKDGSLRSLALKMIHRHFFAGSYKIRDSFCLKLAWNTPIKIVNPTWAKSCLFPSLIFKRPIIILRSRDTYMSSSYCVDYDLVSVVDFYRVMGFIVVGC